jgi:hypothetical protein
MNATVTKYRYWWHMLRSEMLTLELFLQSL